jgi:hypothetical protein
MNNHLNHLINQQRTAELRRAAERARLASDASGQRRDPRDPGGVTPRSQPCRRVTARNVTGLEVERAGGATR